MKKSLKTLVAVAFSAAVISGVSAKPNNSNSNGGKIRMEKLKLEKKMGQGFSSVG